MITSDLKIELIQKIIDISDYEKLMEIKSFLGNLGNYSDKANDPMTDYIKTEKVLVINESQLARIEIAKKQFQNGEFISHQEDQIELEKWFQNQE
jgi:hypothetical protein